ncbi:MAG: hypothetical protein IVW55_18160 [Chloroflexi bacterium]|nr:hypothetical protein [Chloroflexota bacterium]
MSQPRRVCPLHQPQLSRPTSVIMEGVEVTGVAVEVMEVEVTGAAVVAR